MTYSINATSYASGVTRGTVTKIHFVVSSSACSAVIDGTSGTANNGKINFTYTNSTGTLKMLPTGGNLHIWNVNGCLGAVSNGDAATLAAADKVLPKLTIMQAVAIAPATQTPAAGTDQIPTFPLTWGNPEYHLLKATVKSNPPLPDGFTVDVVGDTTNPRLLISGGIWPNTPPLPTYTITGLMTDSSKPNNVTGTFTYTVKVIPPKVDHNADSASRRSG